MPIKEIKQEDNFSKKLKMIMEDLICPDCGSKLKDYRNKNEGRYKGHGSIYCPKCKMNKAII